MDGPSITLCKSEIILKCPTFGRVEVSLSSPQTVLGCLAVSLRVSLHSWNGKRWIFFSLQQYQKTIISIIWLNLLKEKRRNTIRASGLALIPVFNQSIIPFWTFWHQQEVLHVQRTQQNPLNGTVIPHSSPPQSTSPHPRAHLLTADTAITHQFKAALWPCGSARSLRGRWWRCVGLGRRRVECTGSGQWAAGITTAPPSVLPNNNQSEEINCLSKYQVCGLIEPSRGWLSLWARSQ